MVHWDLHLKLKKYVVRVVIDPFLSSQHHLSGVESCRTTLQNVNTKLILPISLQDGVGERAVVAEALTAAADGAEAAGGPDCGDASRRTSRTYRAGSSGPCSCATSYSGTKREIFMIY